MKAIINGKIYNTETATKLGNYEYGICGDLNHVYESLYRTKKKRVFSRRIGRGKYSLFTFLRRQHLVRRRKNHSG